MYRTSFLSFKRSRWCADFITWIVNSVWRSRRKLHSCKPRSNFMKYKTYPGVGTRSLVVRETRQVFHPNMFHAKNSSDRTCLILWSPQSPHWQGTDGSRSARPSLASASVRLLTDLSITRGKTKPEKHYISCSTGIIIRICYCNSNNLNSSWVLCLCVWARVCLYGRVCARANVHVCACARVCARECVWCVWVRVCYSHIAYKTVVSKPYRYLLLTNMGALVQYRISNICTMD